MVVSNEITIECRHCKTVMTINRTKDIPLHVKRMGCNWCPNCEGSVDDYYREWYKREKKEKFNNVNQITLV